METTVVNIASGEKCDVYIGRGRGGLWGNPFIINRHGNRQDVIRKHRPYLIDQFLSGERTWKQIKELHGQALGCYCSPLSCHGDTLRYFADMAVTFSTEEEFLEFVRKEKGETDERPPKVKLQHLQVTRETLERKLGNAQQLHRRATDGGGAVDMRVYDALLQQSEESLQKCNEEIKALEDELGVSPAPPPPRIEQPAAPVAPQQPTQQQQPIQETEQMSTATTPQVDATTMQEYQQYQEFLQWKQMMEQNGGQMSTQPTAPAPVAPPPAPLWTYQGTKPTRSGRTYVEVLRGNEVVVHVPNEHWNEGIFHAAQLDDINPPANGGAGAILLQTEIRVDGRYAGRIAATPDECPTTLQAMLEKFGNTPRHQRLAEKAAQPPVEELQKHENFHFPDPEQTTVENVAAEQQEQQQAAQTPTTTSPPPATNGANGGVDPEEYRSIVVALHGSGLSRPAIKAELLEEHGVDLSSYMINKFIKGE